MAFHIGGQNLPGHCGFLFTNEFIRLLLLELVVKNWRVCTQEFQHGFLDGCLESGALVSEGDFQRVLGGLIVDRETQQFLCHLAGGFLAGQ